MQVFELTIYRVAIQGNDYSEIIYEGINFDDAKMEYNSVNISDFQDDYGGVVELEKFDRLYEYIYDLEDLEDFPFLKHYADNSLFKEIDETEIETLFEALCAATLRGRETAVLDSASANKSIKRRTHATACCRAKATAAKQYQCEYIVPGDDHI